MYRHWDARDARATHQCTQCGAPLRRLGARTRQIVTTVGTLVLARHCYYCPSCRTTIAPLDEALGLRGTNYSVRARQWCLLCGAATSYGEAQSLLATLTPLQVDGSLIESFCRQAGARLEADAVQRSENALQVPEPLGVTAPDGPLYVGLDGAMAPIRDAARPWQEVRVGTVFTTTPGPDGPELDRREYLARLGPMVEFGPRLWERARAWGAMAPGARLVVLGDGAPSNWSLAAMHFPGATEIVDFYHACQHLAAACALAFDPASPAAQQWLERYRRMLKRGQLAHVLRALLKLPVTAGRHDDRMREYRYFTTNRHRMRYGAFQRQGLFIGSGVVESACKLVVTRRLKISGARWSPAGCTAILHLRCAYLTNPDMLRAVA
jgi:hypothetical protein